MGNNKVDPDKIEPPQRMLFWNVIYWEPTSKRLLELGKNGDEKAASKLTKANKYVECDVIKETNDGWDLQIENHNKKPVKVSKDMKCDCPGYHTYGDCSHLLAVRQFLFINSWEKVL